MLSLRENDIQSVPVVMSKSDYTGLTLVDPRVKINEICYFGLFLPQQVRLVIC